ncbi:MAG: alpha/beta fold hydrolase [Solirubrobacterales bacterium]|nr:alpha/beta fold hydrolase [Solirubrobacterales bacterium]MCB8971287.1 alpha/beta fold hydrolase [Thermoleophilales bacterium]
MTSNDVTQSDLNENAETIELHGNTVTFLRAGEGPPLLLLHGIAGSYETWAPLIPSLSRDFTVIAPDMLGHGRSAKPRGDYSLGAYAAGARDILLALGHESATVVGHSLGGGVAMQFAYQFPAHTQRLVLVSSGGLGEEVNIALRAATLPGSEFVLPFITKAWVTGTGRRIGEILSTFGLMPNADITEIARGYASLADPHARSAFIHTARSVIDHKGQRVSARDRLYLADSVPSLIVWGERDRIIPVRHGERAASEMPGSRFELFERSGHFPHLDQPTRFARLLTEFIDSTEPADLDVDEIRRMLEERGQGVDDRVAVPA